MTAPTITPVAVPARVQSARDAFLDGAAWAVVRQQQTLTREMVVKEAAKRYPAPEGK